MYVHIAFRDFCVLLMDVNVLIQGVWEGGKFSTKHSPGTLGPLIIPGHP